eukprot:scaffold5026_cov215-Skeletonema_marinoi.AAC.1
MRSSLLSFDVQEATSVSTDRQQAMEMRDFDYYEARTRYVVLEDITSCEDNAEILRRLRRQDNSIRELNMSDSYDSYNYYNDNEDNGWFIVGEGDDLGWLGYFIGKSKYLKDLCIDSWGEGGNIEAFMMEGINRNQSIKSLHIGTDLRGVSFRNLTPFFRNNHRLANLELSFEVGLECAQSIAHALGESQCHSLTNLRLDDCNLGDEGFAVIATALRTYPHLSVLFLENNNIGLMGCTALADTLRGWGASNLKTLDLDDNRIDDQGLQALAAAITNTKLEELYLSGNLITAVGLRSLSTYFQSERCCLETLYLYRVNFGDEGAVALADGLMGNKSLKCLDFHPDQAGITDVGWAAFSKLLCDPSDVNSTYLSNHNIRTIGDYSAPLDIRRYLDLNGHPHPAMNKILKSHPDLEMEPFFQWKLKFLPVMVAWFERAQGNESEQSIESRKLSSMYDFVRGMPMLVCHQGQEKTRRRSRKRRLDGETK